MATTVEQHKADAPKSIRCAVITVSDTRTLVNDHGGSLVIELLKGRGHALAQRLIVKDDPVAIKSDITALVANSTVQAILVTGGTGISHRDQTFETISAMLTKTLPGYGELFRVLSYEEIGAAAMLSRAVGGLIGQTILLTMPGSPAAVQLAMEKLILPELPHLVREATKT